MQTLTSNGLLLLVVAFSCVEADSESFRCGDYGINYVYRRFKNCTWLGEPEKLIYSDRTVESEMATCAQSRPCSIVLPADGSRSSYTSIDLSEGATRAIEHAPGLQSILMAELGPGYTTDSQATRIDTITCVTPPGYQVQAVLEAKMLRVRGFMRIKYETILMGIPYGTPTYDYRIPVVVTAPLVKDGILGGSFVCDMKPMANMSEIYFHINQRPMNDNTELPVAQAVLDSILKVVPPKNQSVLREATLKGVTAWARAMCFNLDDKLEYHSLCAGCIRFLRDNIIAKANSAYGANWRAADCYLRFDFFTFT